MSILSGIGQKQFRNSGSFMLTKAMSPLVIRLIRDALIDHETSGKAKILVTDESTRMYKLLCLPTLAEFISSNGWQAIASHLIGAPAVLGGYATNKVLPNAPGMGRHRDYPYFALDNNLDLTAIPPLSVQMLWALDDFAEDNGPTMIMPGSHKFSYWPTQEEFDTAAVPVIMKAGSCLIFHGALFHGVKRNTTSSSRMSLLAPFHPYWVKPKESNLGQGENPSSDVQSLLGYDFKAWVRNDLSKVGYGVAKL